MLKKFCSAPGGRVAGLAGRSLMVLFAVMAGCSEPPPPPPPVVEVPAPVAEPEVIELVEMDDVELEPAGKGELEVRVTRNGNKGSIKVSFQGLPDGVTSSPELLDIKEGSSAGKVVFQASQSLGDAVVKASVSVEAKLKEMSASGSIDVVVNKVSRPEFGKVEKFVLQPGASKTVLVSLKRNGFSGQAPVTVSGGGASLTAKVESPADGKDAEVVQIIVSAAATAVDGLVNLEVATNAYGRKVVGKIPVEICRYPFRVESFRVIDLKRSSSEVIRLPIKRRSYDGPLDIELKNLPSGVDASAKLVPEGGQEVSVALSVTSTAKPQVRSSLIEASGGGLQTSNYIILRVLADDDEKLPAGIINVTAIKKIFSDPAASAPLRRKGSIGGRLTLASKQALIDFYGATPRSLESIREGIDWLARCQRGDGSWALDGSLEDAGDGGGEVNEGPSPNPIGATALALLPFLSEGIAHSRVPDGQEELQRYQEVVERGLVYLALSQQRSNDINDGRLDGGMYAHALATIVFCEAYGLSGDQRLRGHAQLALKYLLNAQHQAGGGWRYSPNQPGDLSATGWVFLAIRSAQLTGINVLSQSLERAERFVDSCGIGPEDAPLSRYCYQPNGNESTEKQSMTAAGLLTQQYLGWKKDDRNLLAGSTYLMAKQPPEQSSNVGDIYFYYYATQVLHHLEGNNFDLWNHRMREHLIRTQEKDGDFKGSWGPDGVPHGNAGGRLYVTSLAMLTLQVPYRHLPMYRLFKIGRTSD